jgi:hypothetical protein
VKDAWKSVSRFTTDTVLVTVAEGLHEAGLGDTGKMWQWGTHGAALIAPYASIEIAARASDQIELHQPAELDTTKLLLVDAPPLATIQLLQLLQRGRGRLSFPVLLACNPAVESDQLATVTNFTANPTNGNIVIRRAGHAVAFPISLLSESTMDSTTPDRSAPPRIGEGRNNLRQRSQWFKSRTRE